MNNAEHVIQTNKIFNKIITVIVFSQDIMIRNAFIFTSSRLAVDVLLAKELIAGIYKSKKKCCNKYIQHCH